MAFTRGRQRGLARLVVLKMYRSTLHVRAIILTWLERSSSMTDGAERSNRWQVVVGCATIISAIAAIMVVPEVRKAVFQTREDHARRSVSTNTETVGHPLPIQVAATTSSVVGDEQVRQERTPAIFQVGSRKVYNDFSITLETIETTRGRTEARLTIVNHKGSDRILEFDCAGNSFVVDHKGKEHTITDCALAGGLPDTSPRALFVPAVTYTGSFWFTGASVHDPVIPLIRLEGDDPLTDEDSTFRLEWRNIRPVLATAATSKMPTSETR